MIYFFLLFLVFSLGAISSSSKYLLRINVLFVFLFFALYMGYGTDWIYYNIKFDNISLNNMFNFEFLYSFINYIIKNIGLSYQWVHIVTVAISITFLYLYCTKFNNKNLIFIIAVSFFGIMLFLSQERQGVAVCIFLYSTTINNKFKRNILIILACLFHFSAIFSYVYFYISKRKNFKLFKSIIFFNIFILSFFLFSSFKLFSYIPFIPDFLINKIDIYMGYENLFNFNFSMGYVLNFLIFLYALIIYLGDKKSESYKRGLFFTIIFAELRVSPLVLYRFNYYFLPFLFDAIDEYFSRSKYKVNKCFLLFFFFLYSLRVYAIDANKEEIMQDNFYFFNNKSYDLLQYESCQRNLGKNGEGRSICMKSIGL